MAWICYLPFVIHCRKFTTETAMIFVFASVSSSFLSLIDLLCNIKSICKRFALGAIPFCNASLKYRNCTGPTVRLPGVKMEKAKRDNLSSFSPKPLIFTSEVILPTAPVLNALLSQCFSCL